MKNTARLITIAAAAALVPLAPVGAQTAQPELAIAPGHTVLTVSAEGTSTREPDLAVFSAGVKSNGSTAGEALAANSRAMTQVIAALKRAGISDRDIQTSNLSLNPVYSDPNRAAQAAGRVPAPLPPEQQVRRIIGYEATNTVSVRQRKLGNYGKVIDALVAAGANQINGPSFQLDDDEAALDEARLDAMKRARQRAQLYANAAGLKIVRLLSISENGGYSRPPIAFARMAEAAPSAPPPPVNAGELQMNANVTVLYELAP